MSAQKSRSCRWPAYDLGLVALTVAFAVPLVAYALNGVNMRYSGDDYCYAGLFRQQGFLRTITNTYTNPSPFHGNRVSLTISSGVADAVGPAASAILPALVLVLWLVGLVLLFRGIAAASDITLKAIEPTMPNNATLRRSSQPVVTFQVPSRPKTSRRAHGCLRGRFCTQVRGGPRR